MVEMRTCTKCGTPKPLDHLFFPKEKRGKGGFRSQCKVCCNAARKEQQRRNRRYHMDYERELLEAPLTAAIACLRQNANLVKLIADFDSRRFREEVAKERQRVLVLIEERQRYRSEQATRAWANRRANVPSVAQTVAR